MDTSYNTSRDEITVGDITYDVERQSITYGDRLTLSLNGEDVFEGLSGTVEMEQDQSDLSPRDADNVGVICVHYRGYTLGDEDISDVNFDSDCDRCEDGSRTYTIAGREIEVTCAKCQGNGWYTENPVAYFKRERGARVVLPLTVYEHSGITMRVGSYNPFDPQGWDTSFVGFIFDTPEGRKDCIGDDATDEQIEAALSSEVSVYASWLEGDVSCYQVDDDETNFSDSCTGFIGDTDECERQCFSALADAIVKRLSENAERAEWAARDVVTL